MAGAVWNHKKKLAEVTRRAGRHFQTLGFEKEGKLYLYPEEALYMLETVIFSVSGVSFLILLKKKINYFISSFRTVWN